MVDHLTFREMRSPLIPPSDHRKFEFYYCCSSMLSVQALPLYLFVDYASMQC